MEYLTVGVFSTPPACGNGIANWCKITNPDSILRQVDFDNNGYVTEDIQADGLPEQQTIQYARASGTELVTSVTDQFKRVTAYVYDSLSNIGWITRLYGTSKAVTTPTPTIPTSAR